MSTIEAELSDLSVESAAVDVYEIPTDAPEGDGTLTWDSTTLVLVRLEAGGQCGLGYTYADTATASLIEDKLAGIVLEQDALSPPTLWEGMVRQTRNLGRPGIVSMAISAVDLAAWDLKARLLGLPLCVLLGQLRDEVLVYGSGGFTTYDSNRLCEQLAGWVEQGMSMVKMKVGADPDVDPDRVRTAREAIGSGPRLFVDGNGAYSRTEASSMAERFVDAGEITWFEEPVTSDDLEGLRRVRDHVPAGVEVAAGEYGYDVYYFAQMLGAGAVDVAQADVTRCGGITELLRIDGLCRATHTPLSLHCAPAIHTHVAASMSAFEHLEFFHDHVRIEQMLFDGVPAVKDGCLIPDLDRSGNGLELRDDDAKEFRV